MIKYLKDQRITLLDWSGNLLDLNPIENVWAICKVRIHKLNCTMKRKMIEMVIQVWFRDEKIIENIEVKGGHI